MLAGLSETYKWKLPDGDQLPEGFKVLPLRPVMKGKVSSEVMDAAVRKTVVIDNYSTKAR